MTIQAFFKHMPTSKALQSYSETKISERLSKYSTHAIDAAVSFEVDHELNIARCRLVGFGGSTICVEAADPLSMYAAVDRMAEKLDARLRRKKEKSRSHRLGGPIDIVPMPGCGGRETDEFMETIDAAEVLREEEERRLARG